MLQRATRARCAKSEMSGCRQRREIYLKYPTLDNNISTQVERKLIDLRTSFVVNILILAAKPEKVLFDESPVECYDEKEALK